MWSDLSLLGEKIQTANTDQTRSASAISVCFLCGKSQEKG